MEVYESGGRLEARLHACRDLEAVGRSGCNSFYRCRACGLEHVVEVRECVEYVEHLKEIAKSRWYGKYIAAEYRRLVEEERRLAGMKYGLFDEYWVVEEARPASDLRDRLCCPCWRRVLEFLDEDAPKYKIRRAVARGHESLYCEKRREPTAGFYIAEGLIDALREERGRLMAERSDAVGLAVGRMTLPGPI